MSLARLRMQWLGASVAAGIAATAGLQLVGVGTAAAAAPGWEPDPSAVGTIAFYDASGNTVTSGKLSDRPGVKYFVGSATPAAPGGATSTKAQVLFYTPTSGAPDSWGACDAVTGTTDYPATGAPSAVSGASGPVATGASTDPSFGALAGECPNTQTDSAHANMYQLRLYVSAAGAGTSMRYDSADILVDTAAGTWSEAYPTNAGGGGGGGGAPSIGNIKNPGLAGQTVTVTGTAAPGASVSLLTRDVTRSTYGVVATTTATSSGAYTFSRAFAYNTSLYVSSGGQNSAAAQVLLKVKVTINAVTNQYKDSRGKCVVKFTGGTYPYIPGALVYIRTTSGTPVGGTKVVQYGTSGRYTALFGLACGTRYTLFPLIAGRSSSGAVYTQNGTGTAVSITTPR